MGGMRNDSGIAQVYYTDSGEKRLVKPGEVVPEEHLTRDLRDVLREPYAVPRRPLPSVSRNVDVAGQPGKTFRIRVTAHNENRKKWLEAAPTIRMQFPSVLPSWLPWIASPDAPGARWSLDSKFDFTGTPGQIAARIAEGMRAALRGDPFLGLTLNREEPLDLDPERRTLVVLCIHNAPRWATGCLEALRDDPDVPPFDLVVVDDGSHDAARRAVRRVLGLGGSEVGENLPTPVEGEYELFTLGTATGRLITRSTAHGYLDSANLGAESFDARSHDSIVFLNSDTIPGPGWLRGLRRALAHDGVGCANPLSTNNVDASLVMPPGMDTRAISDAILLTSDGDPIPCLTPTGFCLALRAEVWEEFGPYDAELWGTGYGEETHLVLLAARAGWTLVHAPDVFVFHAKSRSHGDDAGTRKSHEAGAKIRRIHGTWFAQIANEYRKADHFSQVRDRVSALVRLPSSTPPNRRVSWYVKSSLLCGGVHAVMYLSDALRRRGWDSTVVTIEPRDLDFYDNRSAVFAFDGENDLRRNFADEVFDAGHFVSASWVTSETVETIARANPGIVPVHFMQDDERRFEFNRGYARKIEQAWKNDNVVANAGWVRDTIADVTGRDVRLIRVGLDPLVFFPMHRTASPKLRVVALSRNETRHRGTDVLLNALRIAERKGVPLDVRLFGSRPAQGFSQDWRGRLRHDQLAPLVAESDVLVDPSRFQGFGLDAVQALACGTALVCTDNLGCHEYAVDGENALIVENGSPESIANALVRLHEDRALLAKLQSHGPDSVAPLSWDVLAAEWEALLDEWYAKKMRA